MIALVGAVGALLLVLGNNLASSQYVESRTSDDSEVDLSEQAMNNSIETLARWPVGDGYTRGPRSVEAFQADKNGSCLSIGEVLDAIPELSLATELFRNAGYGNILLDDKKVMSTVAIPVNAAFAKPLDDDTQYGANMSAVISERPDIVNSLIGASVWKGLWTSDTFSRRGTVIPTSNKLGSEGSPMTVEAFSSSSRGDRGIRVVAQGSDASVLMSDIAACGPSVVHVIDSILLPFDWDDGARDRTQLDNGRGGVTSGGWGWGVGSLASGLGTGWGWG